jgi:DNA-binding transcriptional MerR regulator
VAIEAGRPYLSIGEVLNVLKDEFSDITVSKIRFLESEGLVAPERTSSGYRKFSEQDIERLRFILRLQRDHFLPLKVIRERLDELDANTEAGAGQSTLEFEETPSELSTPQEAKVEPAPARTELFTAVTTGISLSRDELVRASGLSQSQLRELEGFGVIRVKEAEGGEGRYDEFALEAGKLCKELLDMGLDPRHLRMFRSSVDRWASLAEQMVLPLVKQRNPEARQAAAQTVRELVRVGDKLMQTLLREAVAPYA